MLRQRRGFGFAHTWVSNPTCPCVHTTQTHRKKDGRSPHRGPGLVASYVVLPDAEVLDEVETQTIRTLLDAGFSLSHAGDARKRRFLERRGNGRGGAGSGGNGGSGSRSDADGSDEIAAGAA
eukprot:364989-Chlamydomonas_euryale.AAC.13